MVLMILWQLIGTPKKLVHTQRQAKTLSLGFCIFAQFNKIRKKKKNKSMVWICTRELIFSCFYLQTVKIDLKIKLKI